MSSFIDNLSPKEWESFCEIMLRQHFGAKNFWTVPDEDSGDLGLEFYTVCGTLFQCYYPDKNVDMSSYKSKIQIKINDDLKKLKTNEDKISKMIDDVIIDQWVLLTPDFKSKDLITYCHKKKKEIIGKNISYIDNVKFTVKIETANSYPSGKLYAQAVYDKVINIPLLSVSETEKDLWKIGNQQFFKNVVGKSNKLMGPGSHDFQDEVFSQYIQMDKFLDELREEHPNLYERIEDTARAELRNMKVNSHFVSKDKGFVKSVIEHNSSAFSKHSILLSDENLEILSFGYLSKWLTECNMDFK